MNIASLRTGLFAALVVAAPFTYGCTQPIDRSGSTDGPTSAGSQALYQEGAAWPYGILNVCFSPGPPQNLAAYTQVQSILSYPGWAYVANISFQFIGAANSLNDKCGQGNISEGVTIHWSPGLGNGWTDNQGYYPTNTLHMYLDPTASNFTYQVLHEFGHALGFGHEQERPDNWNNGTAVYCPKTQMGRQAEPGTYLTPYFDYNSVMDYCVTPPILSPGDISGARKVYGYRPTGHWYGSNYEVEPINPDQGTDQIIDYAWTPYPYQLITLHAPSGQGTAWAGIQYSSPGVAAWLDRSFDGGRTWDPWVGYTTIPSGWTLWRTLGYFGSSPAAGMVRACGGSPLVCTAFHAVSF